MFFFMVNVQILLINFVENRESGEFGELGGALARKEQDYKAGGQSIGSAVDLSAKEFVGSFNA